MWGSRGKGRKLLMILIALYSYYVFTYAILIDLAIKNIFIYFSDVSINKEEIDYYLKQYP